MRITRTITAIALLLTGSAAAPAQVEVAPPPHASLEELAKEYVRLGLPLPPKDAELVRIRLWRILEDSIGRKPFYQFAFRLAPSRPGADPRYWVGDGSDGPVWIDPHDVEKLELTPAAEAGAELLGHEALRLALYAKVRGWNDLAAALYARMWKEWERDDNPGPWDLVSQLRWDAFFMWEGRISDPTSERRVILAHLRELMAEDASIRKSKRPEFDAHALVKKLETTVNHKRTAKPGSVEDLIDDLTDYRPYRDPAGKGEKAYQELVEMGFEAVPTLIKHLHDERLTRHEHQFIFTSQATVYRWNFTVGHVCGQILSDLSGDELRVSTHELLDAERARKWFEKAKKEGEEKWLVDHASSASILPVLAAKYPARLVEIYRESLKKPVAGASFKALVLCVASSKMPREQKTTLLEEAAGHAHISFQLPAIARLEGDAFRKRLGATLAQIESRQGELKNYLWAQNEEIEALTSLVVQSRERAHWDSLARIGRRMPWNLRLELIDAVGWEEVPDAPPDQTRTERIRLLVQFLEDRTKEKAEGTPHWNLVEVRDYAARQLAVLFRMPVMRYPFATTVMDNPDTGPLARAIWRAAVMQKAQKELTGN